MTRGQMATEARKERIDRAFNIIKAAGAIEYIRGVSLLSYNLGVTKDLAKEYIQVLAGMGTIQIKNHVVSIPITNKTEEEQIDKILDAKSGE